MRWCRGVGPGLHGLHLEINVHFLWSFSGATTMPKTKIFVTEATVQT